LEQGGWALRLYLLIATELDEELCSEILLRSSFFLGLRLGLSEQSYSSEEHPFRLRLAWLIQMGPIEEICSEPGKPVATIIAQRIKALIGL